MALGCSSPKVRAPEGASPFRIALWLAGGPVCPKPQVLEGAVPAWPEEGDRWTCQRHASPSCHSDLTCTAGAALSFAAWTFSCADRADTLRDIHGAQQKQLDVPPTPQNSSPHASQDPSGTPCRHQIPKGKTKVSQHPAQDEGQAGKSDLRASHHVFPQ